MTGGLESADRFIRPSLRSTVPYSPGKTRVGAVKLSSNENPMGMSPDVGDVIRDFGDLSRYPDSGCVILRRALGEYHKIDPERIVVGNGSDEMLQLCAALFLEPGRNAITAGETFSVYASASRLAGASMIELPLKNGRFDLDAILGRVDGQTSLIYLCNPNNPTGTIFNETELQRFLNRLPRPIPVVLDEAYSDFCDDPGYPDGVRLTGEHPSLIVTRTFSKIYGLAALRVGYGIASRSIAGFLNRIRPPFGVNAVAQKAALAALGDREFYRKCLCNNTRERAFLQRELKKLKKKFYPSHANFIAINMERDSREAFEIMLRNGIAVRSLASFGMPEWIRFTVGLPEDNRRFLLILKDL